MHFVSDEKRSAALVNVGIQRVSNQGTETPHGRSKNIGYRHKGRTVFCYLRPSGNCMVMDVQGKLIVSFTVPIARIRSHGINDKPLTFTCSEESMFRTTIKYFRVLMSKDEMIKLNLSFEELNDLLKGNIRGEIEKQLQRYTEAKLTPRRTVAYLLGKEVQYRAEHCIPVKTD